jgi:hypothetical protein
MMMLQSSLESYFLFIETQLKKIKIKNCYMEEGEENLCRNTKTLNENICVGN